MVDAVVEQDAHAGAARQTQAHKGAAPLGDAVVELVIADGIPGVEGAVELLERDFASRQGGAQRNEPIERGALLQSGEALRGIVNDS